MGVTVYTDAFRAIKGLPMSATDCEQRAVPLDRLRGRRGPLTTQYYE